MPSASKRGYDAKEREMIRILEVRSEAEPAKGSPAVPTIFFLYPPDDAAYLVAFEFAKRVIAVMKQKTFETLLSVNDAGSAG